MPVRRHRPYCQAAIVYRPVGSSGILEDESGCRKRVNHRGPHKSMVMWE
jgi:hypothetical protein